MDETAETTAASESGHLHHTIEEAAEPVAQFWPMKGFVHHNPIHGLEHLPFDEAIREANHLFGAEGYLPVVEYRGFYRNGRIRARSVDRALERVGPRPGNESLLLSDRKVTEAEVLRLHFLFGFEAVDPALLPWQFNGGGALERLRADLPDETTARITASEPAHRYLPRVWNHVLDVLDLPDPLWDEQPSEATDHQGAETTVHIELPFRRSLSDWVQQLAGVSIVDTIDEQMIKWIAAFVDEGMAGWEMPGKASGFYSAWRDLAQSDASGRFLGIERFAEKLQALPAEPEQAIRQALRALEIPTERWREYLTRVLAQLPGWTGFIRWRGLNPEEPIQQENPIDVVHYLGVRLFYELELTRVVTRRDFGVDAELSALTDYWRARRQDYATRMAKTAIRGKNLLLAPRDAWRLFHLITFLGLLSEEYRALTRKDAERLIGWLDEFPVEQHPPVWLEAYEDSYRDDVLSKLSAHRNTQTDKGERPRAQVAFCIDVRSEPFRRFFETTGPYETLGFAGFFGIPISHRVYDTDESVALCPVLLTPQHALFELPRPGQQNALTDYASGSRFRRLGEQLFHDLKHSPIAAFVLVDVLGLFFSVGLIGKTLVRRPYHALVHAMLRWFERPVATKINVGIDAGDPPKVAGRPTALIRGFTVEEQATFVGNGLRTMGLTENLGRFVVLCGHGGNSDNNPYFAALHCGACGGRPGDPNARSFAAMGNHPQVRSVLKERGLIIPEDTWFLGAKHDTNTDRVEPYDLQDVPASHAEDLQMLRRDLERGGTEQALDRCGRIPGAPVNISAAAAYAHVKARSVDWANPRPEWGLSGNAGFIIGRRRLTKGLDLGGRIFLNSYDPEPDPEGAILEKIMTAPLIVGEWINMEHYFSATDPWNYGSGSKVIHNVVSGVGLMLGSQSDLQTGLPLQTVNDGEIHHHEPMRLLAIIEAKPDVIAAIIQRHAILQQLFHNQWVNLVAVDPNTFEFHRYNPDASWELTELAHRHETTKEETSS